MNTQLGDAFRAFGLELKEAADAFRKFMDVLYRKDAAYWKRYEQGGQLLARHRRRRHK